MVCTFEAKISVRFLLDKQKTDAYFRLKRAQHNVQLSQSSEFLLVSLSL
jgi:hypothetical protein